MGLVEDQSLFWSLVTQPDLAAASGQRADQAFLGGEGLNAAARVEIYARMYLWRQIDALREDFPKLALLLGDEGFYQMAERFIRAHPSSHPSVGQLGRRLAAYLRDQEGRADLCDLARLEWARNEVFEEAPFQPIDPQALHEIAPEALLERRLSLGPAVRLLWVGHRVFEVWSRLEAHQPSDSPEPGEQRLLVWRKGFEVFHVALGQEEAEALQRAQRGQTLAELCEPFAETDDPARAAFSAIGSWISEGLVAALCP